MSLWKKSLALGATGTLTVALLPVLAFADTEQAIPQGTGPAVLQQANYFGDLPFPSSGNSSVQSPMKSKR
jgi:hypothetical protein